MQHSLGISARDSEWSTTDLLLTPTELGGLGVPDIMPVSTPSLYEAELMWIQESPFMQEEREATGYRSCD